MGKPWLVAGDSPLRRSFQGTVVEFTTCFR
jgi:hypothetical protein